MAKGKGKGSKRITRKQMVGMLERLFEMHPTEKFELKEIFRTMNLDTHPSKMLCMEILESLIEDDYIAEKPKYVYGLKEHFRARRRGETTIDSRKKFDARHGRRSCESYHDGTP